jgi:hypothetical protein
MPTVGHERKEMQMKTIVFFFALMLGHTSILHRFDVAAGIKQIKKDAFGPLHIETVIEVLPTGIVFIGGTETGTVFTTRSGILAIVHCHPDAAYPLPSDMDKKNAVDLKVPIYTISRSAIWVSLPDGTTEKTR